jgi:hypothetical protein
MRHGPHLFNLTSIPFPGTASESLFTHGPENYRAGFGHKALPAAALCPRGLIQSPTIPELEKENTDGKTQLLF